MSAQRVTLRPIESADTADVAAFLHAELNSSVSESSWRRVVDPPWAGSPPNRGFLLEAGGVIVGVYVAVYADRPTDSGRVAVCNLGAFCVLEPYRASSLRLVRALISQDGFLFTDLSPSGNVVALNARLGFETLDTTTRLAFNLPRPAGRGTIVTEDPVLIEQALQGVDSEIFRDHREAAAARHLVVQQAGRYGYFVFRRDRRKGLPWFATPLYAGGDRSCLEQAWGVVAAHLMFRHHLPFTLAEPRILGFAPGPGRQLRAPRVKMVRGGSIDAADIDYLYSELTLIEW